MSPPVLRLLKTVRLLDTLEYPIKFAIMERCNFVIILFVINFASLYYCKFAIYGINFVKPFSFGCMELYNIATLHSMNFETF